MLRRILVSGPGIGSKNKGVRVGMTWGMKVRGVTLAIAFGLVTGILSGNFSWVERFVTT